MQGGLGERRYALGSHTIGSRRDVATLVERGFHVASALASADSLSLVVLSGAGKIAAGGITTLSDESPIKLMVVSEWTVFRAR